MALDPLDLSLPQYRVLGAARRRLHRVVGARRPPRGEPADRHRGGRRPGRPRPRGAPGRPRGPAPAHAPAHPRRRASSSRAADAAVDARLDEIAGVPRRPAQRRAAIERSAVEPRARPQSAKSSVAAGQVTRLETGAFGTDVRSRSAPTVTSPYRADRRHAALPTAASATSSRRPRAGRGCGACCRSCSRTSGCSASRWSRRSSASSVQVQIPNEVGQAIDALGEDRRGTSLESLRRPSSWCSRLIRFVLTYLSRNYLLQDGVPHRVRPAEHHVRAPEPHVVLVLRPRAVGSAHLACQLRHPLGADVPLVRADRSSCSAASRSSRSREMLSINVPLAFVAMSTMPFVLIVGVQHAEADVPGVVADPGAPRRRRHRRRREHQRRARREVVRGRGRAAAAPHRRGDARRVGERARTPTSGPSGRRCIENLPRLGQAHRAASTAATSPSTGRRRSATSSRSTPTC